MSTLKDCFTDEAAAAAAAAAAMCIVYTPRMIYILY
jgi:hypothetical protein